MSNFAFNGIRAISNLVFGKNATHRIKAISVLNKWRLALLSFVSPARRRQARFERENPTLPWLVPSAIKAIETLLRSNDIGFEWGAGRSTIWLAERVAHLTSIEGRLSWFTDMSHQIAAAGLHRKINLRLLEVSSEYDFKAQEIERYAGAISSFPDQHFDFVLIDGHFREACIAASVAKIKPGGMLIIDNTDVIPRQTFEKIANTSQVRFRNGVSETSIFFV